MIRFIGFDSRDSIDVDVDQSEVLSSTTVQRLHEASIGKLDINKATSHSLLLLG
jgi:hypothetical protein